MELLANDGIIAPKASRIEDHQDDPELEGAIWAFADLDVSAFLGKTEKATVTLPKLLIKKIDAAVQSGAAKSRSSFLANSAIQALCKREDHCGMNKIRILAEISPCKSASRGYELSDRSKGGRH